MSGRDRYTTGNGKRTFQVPWRISTPLFLKRLLSLMLRTASHPSCSRHNPPFQPPNGQPRYAPLETYPPWSQHPGADPPWSRPTLEPLPIRCENVKSDETKPFAFFISMHELTPCFGVLCSPVSKMAGYSKIPSLCAPIAFCFSLVHTLYQVFYAIKFRKSSVGDILIVALRCCSDLTATVIAYQLSSNGGSHHY